MCNEDGVQAGEGDRDNRAIVEEIRRRKLTKEEAGTLPLKRFDARKQAAE